MTTPETPNEKRLASTEAGAPRPTELYILPAPATVNAKLLSLCGSRVS